MESAALLVRIAGGLLVLAAGAIHLWLYFDFFHEVHVVGTLFVLNFAAGTVIGLALLLRAHPFVLAAGLGYAATTLAAFLVSVYHGLFGYVESLGGPWQGAAAGVELAAVAVLLPLLAMAVRPTRPGARGARSARSPFAKSAHPRSP